MDMRKLFPILALFPLICFAIIKPNNINIGTFEITHWTNGSLNEAYSLTASNRNDSVVSYLLSKNDVDFKRSELRLEVELKQRKLLPLKACPLLVTLMQGRHVTSFDLPHTHIEGDGNSEVYYTWSKTVRIDPSTISDHPPYEGSVPITVSGSTCNPEPIPFRLLFSESKERGSLHLGDERLTYVSPTTPKIYLFEFNQEENNADAVVVKISARDPHCMIASIQNSKRFPVFDQIASIRYAGYWLTFTNGTTGITVEKLDFPDGFFLVLVTAYDNEDCETKKGNRRFGDLPRRRERKLIFPEDDTPKYIAREKEVTIVVQKVLSYSEYTWPTFFPLVIYLSVILLTFVFFIFFHRANEARYSISNEKPEVSFFLRSEVYMVNSQDDVDTFKREKLEKKSQRYFWLILTVAIFYCIPVFQLIINYLGILYRTGEQDICYYNNLCSLPLHQIMDFNHIYSNIGYIIFGILFIIFTLIRQKTMETRRGQFVFDSGPTFCGLAKILRRPENGTFDQYGIFYSLGFALFMEGFLSASYHICPNRANFQFDTSFMYAMAVLSYVKIYQFRHSLYFNELMAFILLALVVCCVVFGLLSTNLAFRIILSLVHLLIVVTFQFILVFISRNPKEGDKDLHIFRKVIAVGKELCFINRPKLLVKHHPNKSLFWWTVGWNLLLILNSWTLVYGSNFATQVLYILLANLALYIFYYFTMKGIHGEFSGMFVRGKGWRNPALQSLIYGFVSLIFWIPGLYFFANELSSWELSPAESRERNDSCALLDFYDNHDIWHLLSAPALFFSFMAFLTVDDSLIGRHQESIPVF